MRCSDWDLGLVAVPLIHDQCLLEGTTKIIVMKLEQQLSDASFRQQPHNLSLVSSNPRPYRSVVKMMIRIRSKFE
jgi:hypothetical protein